jgi:hypothetical protein
MTELGGGLGPLEGDARERVARQLLLKELGEEGQRRIAAARSCISPRPARVPSRLLTATRSR